MNGVAAPAALIATLLLFGASARGQTKDQEPLAVLELGGAAEQNLKGSGSNFGPTIAVEITPIENWLELEGGVTSFASHGTREWDTDLLFKKPSILSDKAEFTFVVGPQWVHTSGHGSTNDSVNGEVVLDFMFWPSSKHRFGWYVEPSYGYAFERGHEQSLGLSATCSSRSRSGELRARVLWLLWSALSGGKSVQLKIGNANANVAPIAKQINAVT